jgi:hypothetical protein
VNDPDDLDAPTDTKPRCAVWLHALLLPYWLFVWFVAAALTASSAGPDAQGWGLAPWVGLGIAIFGVGVGFWVTLLRSLMRRRREGRDTSCLLPIFWAVCNVFTVFFAVAYFAWAYLLPALRRTLTQTR